MLSLASAREAFGVEDDVSDVRLLERSEEVAVADTGSVICRGGVALWTSLLLWGASSAELRDIGGENRSIEPGDSGLGMEYKSCAASAKFENVAGRLLDGYGPKPGATMR